MVVLILFYLLECEKNFSELTNLTFGEKKAPAKCYCLNPGLFWQLSIHEVKPMGEKSLPNLPRFHVPNWPRFSVSSNWFIADMISDSTVLHVQAFLNKLHMYCLWAILPLSESHLYFYGPRSKGDNIFGIVRYGSLKWPPIFIFHFSTLSFHFKISSLTLCVSRQRTEDVSKRSKLRSESWKLKVRGHARLP